MRTEHSGHWWAGHGARGIRYNFKPKAKVKVTSLEEAERLMKQGDKVPKAFQRVFRRRPSSIRAHTRLVCPNVDAAHITVPSVCWHARHGQPSRTALRFVRSALETKLSQKLDEKTMSIDDLIDEAVAVGAEYTESMLDPEFKEDSADVDGDAQGGTRRAAPFGPK